VRAERSAGRRLFAVTTAVTIGAIAASGVALAPTSAHAFCRTRTVPVPADFEPTGTPARCFDQGLPLYHSSQCLPFHLLAPESARVPNTQLSNSLGRAFGSWLARNPSCTPGITAIELAPVSGEKLVDYKTGERGHNVFGLVEGPWPHGDGGNTLSLATLTFNATTGEIYDADLEIRADVDYFFGDQVKPDAFDFESVITHEAGHILGLAHTSDTDAVMFASLTPGSIRQRTLAADDQAAICAIYPDRQTRATGSVLVASSSCDLSPVAPGTPTACGADPDVTHGCSVGAVAASRSPGSPGSPGSLAALAGLAFFALLYARRIFASASSDSSEI
jgi:hypothetical protein